MALRSNTFKDRRQQDHNPNRHKPASSELACCWTSSFLCKGLYVSNNDEWFDHETQYLGTSLSYWACFLDSWGKLQVGLNYRNYFSVTLPITSDLFQRWASTDTPLAPNNDNTSTRALHVSWNHSSLSSSGHNSISIFRRDLKEDPARMQSIAFQLDQSITPLSEPGICTSSSLMTFKLLPCFPMVEITCRSRGSELVFSLRTSMDVRCSNWRPVLNSRLILGLSALNPSEF